MSKTFVELLPPPHIRHFLLAIPLTWAASVAAIFGNCSTCIRISQTVVEILEDGVEIFEAVVEISEAVVEIFEAVVEILEDVA